MLMDHGSASPGPKRSATKSNSTKDYVAHRLKQTDSPSAKRKLGRQEDEADKEDDEDDDLVEIVRMRKAQRMGVRTQDP